MRVDLKKYLFIGMETTRTEFFEKAQELGIVHFIDPQNRRKTEWPADFQNIASAIKVLRSQPVVEQEESDDYFKADEIANAILLLHQQLEKDAEQQRILALEIARVAPFGNYDPEAIALLEKEGKRVMQFFCAKEGVLKNGLPEELIYINTEYGLDYFIGINRHPVQYEKMIEVKPEAPASQLKAQQHRLLKDIQAKEHSLKAYAKYNQYLHHALINKFNTDNRSRTAGFAASTMDEMLFAIEGWVPVDSVEGLNALARTLDLYIEEVAIEQGDVIPTCLKNTGLARIGEDLVHIYDTPSPTDKDPSLWVLGFFSLFFAMIIGDAGYGLVLLLAGLYFQRKQKKITHAGKRFFTLLYMLSCAIIVWGILNTSFFGISIPLDSPLRKLSLITWLAEKKAAYHFAHKDATAAEWISAFPGLEGMTNGEEILKTAVTVNQHSGHVTHAMYDAFANNIAMELALFIGVVHIILSLLRYLNRHISYLGWIVALIGGYLFIPSFLAATSMAQYLLGIDPEAAGSNGLLLIYGGLAFALAASFFEYGVLGPVETLNRLIQLFSDSMSYLRLYALGLSGALVTSTINDLAGNLNFVFAGLLFLVGHLVNLALGIMGGVIHGLRLNFLEWYHYSFEGDGKRFDPLQKIEIE